MKLPCSRLDVISKDLSFGNVGSSEVQILNANRIRLRTEMSSRPSTLRRSAFHSPHCPRQIGSASTHDSPNISHVFKSNIYLHTPTHQDNFCRRLPMSRFAGYTKTGSCSNKSCLPLFAEILTPAPPVEVQPFFIASRSFFLPPLAKIRTVTACIQAPSSSVAVHRACMHRKG